MNFEIVDNILTIHLNERIDTTNVDEVGKEIDDICANNSHEHLVLDGEDLVYISSAGLRQILKLKKTNADLKIVNVASEVYEIFEMTGFSEMMDIQKGYRKMSVEGCEVLGEGSNGVVYRLNPDTIIKVYKNNDALEDIKREKELAKTALVMGINTAIPFDVVKVGDKFGSVFELVNCKSITKWILEDKEHIDEYIDVMVSTLKEVHNTEVKEGVLPRVKPSAISWVEYLKPYIDEEHYNKLYKLVNDVPESNHMIHGDYHCNNVHYNKKESILIDMDTIAVGNPIFEFASIYNAFVGFGITDKSQIEQFLKVDIKTAEYIWHELIKKYFNIEDYTEIENKAKVIGYTRILRRTLKRSPENTTMIDASKKVLLEAIDSVDSIIL